MSKQTINIGASPNDGTGTPLRTSFDYTNQNFTELYTALGGGVGLPGATTQVIFNDGGTNLAGDAGLVYNKTTDALTVAGLVTAGSATITGAATVGTTLGVTGASTLASAVVTGALTSGTTTLVSHAAGYTGKVGIGTATPVDKLQITSALATATTGITTANGLTFQNTDTTVNNYTTIQNRDSSGSQNAQIQFVNVTQGGLFQGAIAFTTRVSAGDFAERARFNPTGNLAFASGKGIDFAAVTGGTGTATANVLNDYEEGTFTPTVGGTATYTVQSGRYTKIGNRVYVNMRITILLVGTGSSFLISGLPFTAKLNSPVSSVSVGYFNGLATSVNYIAGFINDNTSAVTMTGTAAASANITNGIGVIGNASDLALSFFYEV